MKIDWNKHIHDGWRRSLGVFCLAFALAMASLYFLDRRVPRAEGIAAPQAIAWPTAETSASPLPAAPTPNEQPLASKIRLSTATQAQLEGLPGIGPTKARAIIEHRDAFGFKSVNDLDKVKGIGPATLAKLRPLVEL